MAPEQVAKRPVGVFPFTATPAHHGELRQCASLWQDGPEHFWPYPEVLASLARSECSAYYVAATPQAPWLGFMLVEVGLETADLLYLYVKTPERSRGLAKLMMTCLLQVLREKDLQALLLEVRPSNKPALNLYKALGFTQCGRRPRYYRNGEDAIILQLNLALGAS